MPGDRIRLANVGHKKVGDLLTDANVEPWLRHSAMVIEWPTVGIRAVQLGWNQRFRVSGDAHPQPSSSRILLLERLIE